MEIGYVEVFIMKHIFTFIIGLIIGAYLKRMYKVIKKYLYIIGDLISSKNRFKGTWTAIFIYGDQPFAERIRLYIVFDKYVLGLIEDTTSQYNNATRLYGVIENEAKIKGTWYHPDEVDLHSGTFDLVLDQNGKQLSGVWTGQNVKHASQSGTWDWNK